MIECAARRAGVPGGKLKRKSLAGSIQYGYFFGTQIECSNLPVELQRFHHEDRNLGHPSPDIQAWPSRVESIA
jgi:hypothetical protein